MSQAAAMDPPEVQATAAVESPASAESPSTVLAEEVDSANGDPETPTLSHDSLVTVRLSEPPALTLDTSVGPTASDPSSDSDLDDSTPSRETQEPQTQDPDSPSDGKSLHDELGQCQDEDSSDSEEVNWAQLEKTEDEQTKTEDTDNSAALLLARLEQENAKLATNPKSVKVESVDNPLASGKARPPSMAQLRQMVTGPTPSALRYSMLPPPAMTDLEFYAALVKDYQQTAARLPTLLSNKIRKGIPPPLRGVVWQSMAGARDAALEEQYERFCGESSPYELIIGKDLGRSFPGVDMFRDPEGDGQRMLGRVLKAFSLYDTKIGYCQGLAFLVGPLLMHMSDTQAFCVLVRLMERYDLRDCFLPNLAGLHVRIYQFKKLLKLNVPAVATHLEDLQVDPAYVSQWFLSFFAVTCPLPMLFRIYDVIFAEGASETLMRVALSLMRKNEARLLACTELEDVMQLLLSRGLWDCYHYNADEFVQDFVSLTGEVSREKLSQLEQGYRESLVATANASRTSDISTAASRFLGRIWASSASLSPKAITLSPGLGAPARPTSILRRSTSKQSLASTLNSMEASSASVTSSTSTDATNVSRDSTNTDDESASRESTPVGPKSAATRTTDERYLHSQIEDLLTALSELQRSHALLANQLQREQEEREEDKKVVNALLVKLRQERELNSEENVQAQEKRNPAEDVSDDDATPTADETEKSLEAPEAADSDNLSDLIDTVESRFSRAESRRSSTAMQSKAQLRVELIRAREQLASSESHSQELSRQVHTLGQESSSLRDQIRDSHTRVRTLHADNQRLEKQLRSMRTRTSVSSAETMKRDLDKGGLRELKLGRSKSSPTQPNSFAKRSSSLPQTEEATPSENEALLLELVQAKTAEAMAKQEAEEAKQKLEALRRATGVTAAAEMAPAAAVMGVFGRLTGQGVTTPPPETKEAKAAGNTASGGFWGWRR